MPMWPRIIIGQPGICAAFIMGQHPIFVPCIMGQFGIIPPCIPAIAGIGAAGGAPGAGGAGIWPCIFIMSFWASVRAIVCILAIMPQQPWQHIPQPSSIVPAFGASAAGAACLAGSLRNSVLQPSEQK